MIKVLFVCLGNICRSPMAQFVFKQMVTEKGLSDRFEIDSAATESYNEMCHAGIHHGTREMLKSMHVPFEEHYSRRIRPRDYAYYDYILAMDDSNIEDIQSLVGPDTENKIHRLLDFTNNPRNIRDPWYTGNFDESYWDIYEGCQAFLEHLKENSQNELELIPFIKQALINIEGKKFKKTNSTAILSLRVLSGAIFALCRDAFALLENNRIFTACSLTCQAVEAQIQLLCIDKLYDTKGKDYYEFAFVEQLRSLEVEPGWQEKTLKRMQSYNCERFYIGKGKSTTDIDSYYKNWYKSFANNIKGLSKIAFPHFLEVFHSCGISFVEENLNIDLLYENYQTLCSFKHLSPFIVGNTFLMQGKLFEEQKMNHKEVALTSIYTALISVILVLNKHNEQISTQGCLFNRL